MNMRWVLNGIGLVSIIVAIWFGADYIKLGDNNRAISHSDRIAIMLAMIALWLVNELRQQWQQSKQNAGILNGLQDSTEQHTNQELQALQSQFDSAIGNLKNRRFDSQGGKMALYQLPWYIIIGPPGSGKTTAIANSGLNFPLAQTVGKRAIGGIGGTRNCDWWFTDDAVLIDTAGRYTTHDSHQEVDNRAWFNFLGLLRKYRRQQPINGAMIAISAQDFLGKNNDQLAQLATSIRDRIDELTGQLGIEFPIYFIVTKCDLIDGFSDYFSQLDKVDREQVWGSGFDLNSDRESYPELCKRGVLRLVERLEQRKLHIMNREPDSSRRARMQSFPAQFAQLQQPLEQFVSWVFTGQTVKKHTPLRGIYFTSGTQEGTPIDRMLASSAQSLNQAPAPAAGEGKSFFISKLFSDYIFTESSLASANPKLQRMLFYSKLGIFVAGVLALLVSHSLWTTSLIQTRVRSAEIDSHIQRYQNQKPANIIQLPQLVELADAIAALQQAAEIYGTESGDLASDFNLFDERVSQAVRRLYQLSLTEEFLPGYIRTVERKLASPDAISAFDTLKSYIMLGDSRFRDSDYLYQWIRRNIGEELDSDDAGKLQASFDALWKQGIPDGKTDITVIQGSRNKLLRQSAAQRIYAIIQYHHRQKPATQLNIPQAQQVFMPAALFDGIPNHYLRDTFRNTDLAYDSEYFRQLTSDSWVLGDRQPAADQDIGRVSAAVKQLYTDDYNAYWRRHQQQVQYRRPADLAATAAQLRLLASAQRSPMVQVLSLVNDNLAAGGDRSSRELRQFLDPGNYQRSYQQLVPEFRQLAEELETITRASDPEEAAFRYGRDHMDHGKLKSLNALFDKDRNIPEPVRDWLQGVAKQTWTLLLQTSEQHLRSQWQEKVLSYYDSRLRGRYPLDPEASKDAALTALNTFFREGGIEDAFFDEFLSAFVDARSGRVRSRHSQQLPISKAFVQQHRTAEKIRQSFYTAGSANVQQDYNLKLLRLGKQADRANLYLGHKSSSFDYVGTRNTNKSFQWQGGRNERIRFTLYGRNGDDFQDQYLGTWAWFRFLDTQDKRKIRRNKATVKLGTGENTIHFELSRADGKNPLDYRVINEYQGLGF